jgi:rubrerythrin
MAIFQATDIVEMALELEKSGEIFYRTVAKKAASPQVEVLFEELAEQEQRHYAAFEGLSRTVWDKSPVIGDSWDQYLMYLQATIQSAFFEGSDKALALAEQVSDEKEALRMAVAFEKETMLFFHDLRDKVSEADRAVVERIIAEEKAHLRRLAAMIRGL